MVAINLFIQIGAGIELHIRDYQLIAVEIKKKNDKKSYSSKSFQSKASIFGKKLSKII